MDTPSLLRLVALAAIWGASFLFMRLAAPALGATLLAECRVALAAIFLLGVGALLRKPLQVRAHWRHYLVLGFFNSALPFLLFAFAAKTLSASLLSILNATAPVWAAITAAVWNRQLLPLKPAIGLLLGIAGVSLLVGFETAALRPGAGIAVICVLGAAFSYGVASTYAKSAQQVEPFCNAHGSMWAATLLIAPAVPFVLPGTSPGATVMLAVVALGILCSGVAYLLYFRLIGDLGAASALTVTFLIPVFGVLWGYLFLGETVGWHTVTGSLLVIVGTALVTGFNPCALFVKRKERRA